MKSLVIPIEKKEEALEVLRYIEENKGFDYTIMCAELEGGKILTTMPNQAGEWKSSHCYDLFLYYLEENQEKLLKLLKQHEENFKITHNYRMCMIFRLGAPNNLSQPLPQ